MPFRDRSEASPAQARLIYRVMSAMTMLAVVTMVAYLCFRLVSLARHAYTNADRVADAFGAFGSFLRDAAGAMAGAS